MAHGDKLGGPLGGGNARESRHLQRISFGILRELFQHRGLDLHECLGRSGPPRLGLRRHIHHGCAALLIVMRERTGRGGLVSRVGRLCRRGPLCAFLREWFFHYLRSTRIISPAAQDSRSESVTRKALARDSAPMSPDPCQGSGDRKSTHLNSSHTVISYAV